MKNGRYIVGILSLLAIAIVGCESKPPFETRRISLSDSSDIIVEQFSFVSPELVAILDSGKTVTVDWKAMDGFKVYDITSGIEAFSATLSSYVRPCGFSLGEIACSRRAAALCKGRCHRHCGK